ncbi:MAG: hypothetical protein JOZ87_17995 [Chloroflexi bacterium]|nr:hypothetical protein [Chloroflexota bacterium]
MPNDPVLARQTEAMAFFIVGIALTALAVYLRVRVFIGKQPGGVDTWYYLASAEALRRQKRLPISLPQYLLHDQYESYPAGFPIFLAILPEAWLSRYFWLLSPLIDACHLLLLYFLSFRLTDSVLAAGTAGLIYAVTPQLISETRNLNGRAFASLLQTLAMLALLRSVIPSVGPTRALTGGDNSLAPMIAALILIALLYNTHTSTTIAFLVSAATLTVVTSDWRFVVLAALGLPLAIVISGGYYLRVVNNHIHALRFWMRNVRFTRAHQVHDSPIFGSRAAARGGGLYRSGWRAWAALGARVLGENPFILAMLVTPIPNNIWAFNMYWWAVGILAWSMLTTFGGPLRILGPGFHYMKASVFPTAYTLAVAVNIREGGLQPVDVMLFLSFLGSFAALAYFYRVMDRRQTEQTASTPPDLVEASEYLRQQPGRHVLVLPTMYADFVTYHSGKGVVWGGHSGDLRRLEEFFPVVRKPLSYFFERYAVDYLLLDLAYTTLATLKLESATEPLNQFGSIALYQVRTASGVGAPGQTASALAQHG